MLNRKFLYSALLLIIIFAVIIGIATFIENSNSEKESWDLVYNTIWFEILAFILIVILIINIFIFKMYKKEKLTSLMFHFSFILIFIGAIISKHFGFIGFLHVQEENSANIMLTSLNYLDIQAAKDNKTINFSKPSMTGFDKPLTVFGKPLKIDDNLIHKNAEKRVSVTPGYGEGIVVFEILSKQKREKYTLFKEETLLFDDFNIYFNKEPEDTKKPYMKIIIKMGKTLHFVSNVDIQTNYEENFEKNKMHKFRNGILYKIGGVELLPSQTIVEGEMKYVPTKNPSNKSVFEVDVNYDGVAKKIALVEEQKHVSGYIKEFKIKEVDFKMRWGQKPVTLPFSVYLKSYDVVKYPGSKDVSSYESRVQIKDLKGNDTFDTMININNPFSYAGYMIFQTRYERDDSTLFEVNYNPGKWFFYIGYILLTLGLILNLFNPNSRFRQLLSSTK